jgi:outer membrane autotransporter protein
VTQLGARFSTIWRWDIALFGRGPIGELGIEPELHLSWNHEFGDRGRHVDVTDASGTSTRLEGAESGRDYFLVGAGYTMRIHEIALVYLSYDARVESDRIDQMARAGLMLHW